MSIYIDKPQSLIDRKKAQWAREREELEGLSAPWSCIKDAVETSRTRNVGKLNSTSLDLFTLRDRRQSLPPIYKNQTQSYPRHNNDKEMGGETSGYGSDNPNNTPEYVQQSWNQHIMGYESSSSARDDRAKWGDRGVGVGKFWDPQDIKYFNKVDDTPGWVKRGLQGETEVIVSNTSPAESPEQEDNEQRPYTSSTISQTRSHIRGQNNPVDPVELAERERKRQAALAHQEAIKQQLEEREQRRKEERERRIREEYEEELRIEREQEMERKRRLREEQALKEKLDNERKRKKALEEAIQLAEKQAQEHKIKQKMLKQVNLNISENVVEKEKIPSPRTIVSNGDEINNNILKNNEENKSNNKPNNVAFITNTTSSEKKENNIDRNRVPTPVIIESPRQQQQQPVSAQVPRPQNIPENVTMVIQSPYDGFSNFPFAILMPSFQPGPIGTPLPVAVQIPEQTPRARTENRILTPTQYRNRQLCDSSTQTDFIPNKTETEIKYIREKLMDLNFEGRSRKDSRSRTGERVMRDNQNDRPKWGANRPPTRYMKQSEKDPFYQRKKIRQKTRQLKIYDEKHHYYSQHSSDESQMGTPRSYRKNGYIEKRRTRATWQKNVQVYQTEIVPLLSDKDRIYYKKTECIKCCCDCRSQKHKYPDEVDGVDILRIEHTPREGVKYKNHKKDCLGLPECNNSSSVDSEVLEKLNSLHHGLMFKQEQWQNTRSPSSCSSPKTEINC